MKVYYKLDRVMKSGEIVIVGRCYKDDVLPASEDAQMNGHEAAHGETVFCRSDEKGHEHSKSCAVALLDAKDKDGDGKEIAGTSIREKIEAYFAAWDADPAPVVDEHAELPTKEVQVVEDGKRVTRTVADRDL